MKLDMFKDQLDESRVNNKIHDMSARVKELRALNNSADEICRKIAKEFDKDYISVKKYLLPRDLKRFASMSITELHGVGESTYKKLLNKYRKYTGNSSSKAGTITNIMNGTIEKR